MTAVEWFTNKLEEILSADKVDPKVRKSIADSVCVAKAMERQQIEEAHSHNRCIQSQNYDCFKKAIESASDYFTQTYQQ